MSREAATAYKAWMQTPVYRDVINIIEDIKTASVRDEDSVSTANLSVAVIAEARGIRKGLIKLVRTIEERSLDSDE